MLDRLSPLPQAALSGLVVGAGPLLGSVLAGEWPPRPTTLAVAAALAVGYAAATMWRRHRAARRPDSEVRR